MKIWKKGCNKNKFLSFTLILLFIFHGTFLLSQNVPGSNNETSIKHQASRIQNWVLVIHGGAGGTAGQKMPKSYNFNIPRR